MPGILQLLLPAAWWVHNLSGDIVRINSVMAIRWYGLAYVAGFAIAWFLLYYYDKRKKYPLDAEERDLLMIALMLGILIGGRVGYVVFYGLGEFLKNPLFLFQVWTGGMASHGGLIGLLAGAYWFSRKKKRSLLKLGDMLVTIGPPGVLLGRIANFINGELWGKVSELPWAVIFPQSAYPGFPVDAIPPRHPSQLYEAFFEGLLLFLYLQWRFWARDPKKSTDGMLVAEFMILYSIFRIFCELFREPDASLILGMSRGIFYSLLMLTGGSLLALYLIKTKKKSFPRVDK